MKIALSFFSFFTVLIGTMLFIQFQVYSEELDSVEEGYHYSQEIEITYRGGSLDIVQHFKNLPSEEIAIQWPKNAVNPSCFIENEHSCARLSEDMTTFKAGETRAQSISYVIPLEKGLQSGKLMKNIMATLKNGDTQFSTVHITTDREIEGQWVTGLPLIGEQQLALVNYAMFSGEGPVKDLFWQSGNLDLQKQTDILSIYSKTTLPAAFFEKLEQVHFLNDEHLAVINGTNIDGLEGYRMVFLPDVTVSKVQQTVINSQLETSYQFGESPHWLKEVVASYLTGTVFGSDKTKEVVSTVTAQMSEQQLANWKERLIALAEQEINANVLDEQLSTVLGASTNFFKMNAQSNSLYPFLFIDSRDLFVNLHEQKDIQVILKDGEVLYAADALLKALGYEVEIGENGYYVSNETRAFRFPSESGFYVFNKRRYNTVSTPFKVVGGQYYIEESWLQRLFLIELTKSNNRITIKATEE